MEDNLFTRQEVIAMLDLSAQPRKYQCWAWESLRGSRQLAITENTSGVPHHGFCLWSYAAYPEMEWT